MADAITSGACDLIGLGRTAVLQLIFLNNCSSIRKLADDEALAKLHIVRGQWLSNMMPVKVEGSELPIQLFYFNIRRLGPGLKPDPVKSIPGMVLSAIIKTVHSGLRVALQRIAETVGLGPKVQKIE